MTAIKIVGCARVPLQFATRCVVDAELIPFSGVFLLQIHA